MTFAAWEVVLLAVLMLVTAAIFVRDLAPKLRYIRAGKPDRARTDRLGRRLLTVLREVVFQWKVVGGRPVAGFLHALVFLGFVFFAFETTDHFLEPLDVHFLAALFGPALPAFRAALAVAAVAVSVGIVGLAIRRFVLVKISPDPKSWSSGVVALMILGLMLTYLNGAAAEPVMEKASWWLHSGLILAFPPLILRSKHFHILMSPFDIFFRTHRLGELLPLELDEEVLMASEEEVTLGLETVADVPWKMRMDFLTCVECKRCTEQCPAWNCGQELNPRGFILAGRAAQDEAAPVVGSVLSETALGQCTSCGACEAICPVGIEHLNVLVGAKRAQALATGKGMVAGDFLAAIERYGNPFSEPAMARQDLVSELELPIFDPERHEYLLWMGCVWSYNKDARSSLVALTTALDRAGVGYGVLAKESCSGHHSRRQGEELQFQTLAGENMERFRESGVKKAIAPCPHCFHTLRREYPTLDADFELETIHHSELLARLVQEGKLSIAGAIEPGRRVTFHDPCYLGRYEGVFEAPRQVIRGAGFELLELPRRRERSFCCGGGNAGFVSPREEEKRVDQERKREIAESGADVLVTACPECKMMLDAAVDQTVDLAELVAAPAAGGGRASADA